MTCIIGYIDRDSKKIWMGGDSAGVSGYNMTIRKDPKVFTNGKFIIGFISSFRMGQLLKYKWEPPKPIKDVDKYIHTHVIDSIRACFKDNGYTKIDNNEESGGIFLLGYKDRLFKIESDFQVGEERMDFTACGCGEQYAYGNLFGSHSSSQSIKTKVKLALYCASFYSCGVSEPFNIISQDF